ncbi:unnamed protein product [Somion occarium]|uniref:Uncharacterized protein n=1 Tax=Somion occarium TaxID=3059160 RepID=A0ABP1D749_9APHY
MGRSCDARNPRSRASSSSIFPGLRLSGILHNSKGTLSRMTVPKFSVCEQRVLSTQELLTSSGGTPLLPYFKLLQGGSLKKMPL